MSELITTLHPQDDNSVNLYPNVKLENIIDGKAEDAGKFVKVNEEGKFIVETVNIPEPQQVNNSTVTIKQGGVDKGSFTLNQAEDATIELDAGGAGESGSSMYATSSAISKGIPAHIEAVNPIRVGDTISQLYFNTNQDIKSYLENSVTWSDGNKVQEAGGICIYTLLSALSDENSLGFRSLKVGDYIKCLKIKPDFEPGDSKVDSELNSWLSNILSSNSSVTLLNVSNITSSYEALRAYTSDNSTYELQLKSSQDSGWSTIYSSTSGYSYNSYNSEEHAYNVTNSSKEVQIETINESTGWNSIFFGAISDIGEPLLTAFLYPENPEYYIIENTYFLGKSMFAMNESGVDAVYYSSGLIPMDTPVKAGWHVTAGQSITLDLPEKAKVVNDAVSKIAANDNSWVNVPEVLGSIYQDKILGTDEVKVNDILIDTKGLFGKVKELSEEPIKNQHPENPFTVGEEVNSDSVLYFDTSIIPDVSKFDWSSAEDNDGQLTLMLANPLPLIAVKMTPFVICGGFGVKINNPIYLFGVERDSEGILYLQVDPSDMDTLAGTYLTEEFPIESWNNWVVKGQYEHEGSIYKIPAGLEETSTISDIISQDIWGSCVTKDGKWIEDTPTLKTKVSCESLRQLPTDYRNISGTPIITINSPLESNFIKTNYINKYIQDSAGIIYFCDGEQLYELKGSSGGFTGDSIRIDTTNGIRTSSTSASSTSYDTTIGLETASLGDYSQADGDQVFGKRSGNYGWINLPSQSSGVTDVTGSGAINVTTTGSSKEITLKTELSRNFDSTDCQVYTKQAGGQFGWASIVQGSVPNDSILEGTGIKIDAPYAYSHKISLSQDVQDKLAKIPDTAIETYSEGTGIALTQTSGNDKQISLSQDYITKLKPIMDAQDDLITDLVHKTTDNETAILKKYTKPETGIPASDLASDVQASLTKANSALQESALSGYATTSQVNAKYTKPAAGIPETDLSADVQSALTKANSAITSLPTNTVTTDTEQTVTGKKAFNGGLSSSTTGSNGIQTTVDFGSGSNVKVEQEKSGAKVGIQYNISENQLSIYSVSGETEHRLDFNGDGVKYGASELATKADLNAKIANSNFIASADYDNTTLKAHIDEILSYVNSENGGTLVSVGFKVGTTGASTTITNLHMSSDNTISIDTETDVILGAGSYYYAYPEQVVTSGANEGVFFTCRNGFTLGHGILYITDAGTKEAKLTGESTVITSATQITKMMFQDVDISEVNLEHLTLNFYKFNQAE